MGGAACLRPRRDPDHSVKALLVTAFGSVGLSPSNSPSSKPPMSAGPMEALDVDCAAKAPQGGLLKCLG
jgi:hypothetical protein